MKCKLQKIKAIPDKEIRNAVATLINRHEYVTARVVVTEVIAKFPEDKEIKELLNSIRKLEPYDINTAISK